MPKFATLELCNGKTSTATPIFFLHFPVPLMDFDVLKSKLDFFGTLTSVPYALKSNCRHICLNTF